VRAAQVVTADGERLFVSKASKDATNFDVANVPEGRELRYEGVANSYGSALTNLTLDDVVPAGEVAFDDPPTAVTTFWTFDHLRVDVTLQERDEKLYAKIETSYDDVGATAAGAPEPPPPPPPAEETSTEDDAAATDAAAEDGATADAEPKVDAAPEPAGPKPEDVQKEAEEIRARTQSWVYVLPTWKKSSFMKRMDELLKEPTDAETSIEGLDGTGDLLLPDAMIGGEGAGAASDASETTGDVPPPAETGDESGATPPSDESGDDGATPPPDESGTSGDTDSVEPPPSDEPTPEDTPPPPPQDGGGDGDGR
jgi:hypothetical protein